MQYIKVGRSHHAIVDDRDYALVAAHKWYYEKGYARTTIGGHKVRMHRLIARVTRRSVLVDHKNNNRLDNRRENLRCCHVIDNNANRAGRVGTSRYKGVSWYPHIGKWVARISGRGRRRHLGVFVAEINAALAYDRAALELYGEFAWTNFSPPRAKVVESNGRGVLAQVPVRGRPRPRQEAYNLTR